MATVTFYQIPYLQPNRPITLSFTNKTERDNYFNSIAVKYVETDKVGWIRDSWNVNNKVSLPYNFIDFAYNYAKVVNDSSLELFFYITDARELNDGMIEVNMKLDTVLSFVTTNGSQKVNLGTNRHLVLREHKPRFNYTTSKPIFDRFKEPHQIDQVVTTKVEKVDKPQPSTYNIDITGTANSVGFKGAFTTETGKTFTTANGWYIAPIKVGSDWKWYSFEDDGSNPVSVSFLNDVTEILVEYNQNIIAKAFMTPLTTSTGQVWETGDTQIEKVAQKLTPTGRIRFAIGNLESEEAFKPVAFVFTEQPMSVPFTTAIQNISAVLGDSISGNYKIVVDSRSTPITDDWSIYYHRIITSASGQWRIARFRLDGSSYISLVYSIPEASSIVISLEEDSSTIVIPSTYTDGNPNIKWTTIAAANDPKSIYNQVYTTKGFGEIDYTDTKFQKIYEFPYLPDGMDLKVKTYDEDYQIYVDWNASFENQFTVSPFFTSFDMSKSNKNRVPFNDPKIYTSQYTQIIMSIHGQSLLVKRELINDNNLNIVMKYDLINPSTIFLKYAKNVVERNGDDSVLLNINNVVGQAISEGMTYAQYFKENDELVNNIRRGAIDRNTSIDTFNQVAGILGGLTAGIEKEKVNKVQMASRAASAGLNIVGGLIQAYEEKRLNDIAYQNKMMQLMLSEVSFTGSSLNHMKEGDKDMLWITKTEPIEIEKKYLDDIFYYTGYATLELKELTFSNLRTRRYFDYKRAILDITETDMWITEEIKSDIVERFANGITIIHMDADPNPDPTQTKENWER